MASRRLTTALRITGATVAVLVLIAGAIAYWALDRYVFDHVQIASVSAFEQEARASGDAVVPTTTGPTTDGSDSVDPTGATGDGVTATGAASDSDTESVLTDTSYTDGSTSISISTVVTGEGDDQVTYYVADVVLSDATQLRGGFANDQFGTNIIDDTSVIAAQYDALFAINGDYYGFRDSGIVIRNGVLFRDDGARTGLAIYADGHMEVYDETTTTGAELIEAGVWNTLSFGPALLDGGEIVEGIEDVEVDTNFGNHSIQGNQPRTGVGMIDENHFVFVVVDGRSEGYSRGVTMTEFAEIFQELGATVAYNLDGGGSATMVFDGELVNNPLGHGDERGTSDILYVAAEQEAAS